MHLTENRIAFANALRGIAAISVVISHYFSTYWYAKQTALSFANVPTDVISVKGIPLLVELLNSFPLFNWGHFGVSLFFLISGFVITLSLTKYSRIGFLIARVFRIYPVYFAGFTVTIVSLIFSSYFFGLNFPYTIKEIIIHYFPGLRDILWSTHIDGVVWTLEIEIKFYIICIIFHNLLKSGDKKFIMVPIILSIFQIAINIFFNKLAVGSLAYKLIFVFSLFFLIFPFMCIGVYVSFFYKKRIKFYELLFFVVILLVLFSLQLYTSPFGSLNMFYNYVFALSIFILAAFVIKDKIFKNKVFNFFADISYPLYVAHGIFGYVAISFLFSLDLDIIYFYPEFVLLLVFIFSIGLAYLIHRIIEIPSHEYGKWLANRLNEKKLSNISIIKGYLKIERKEL